uniref:Nucleoside diphosphate kinase-like domain-containing protein n=1 Tax=Oncorhynchus tshawytscha TaxID=74940 RepID=A0A8C8HL87_ONCTS
LPPPRINVPLVTLCLFKPGVWSHALGKILSKVQRSGFTVVGLHVLVLDNSTAVSLASDPSAVEAHVQYLSSGPSLALCLQRENAVKRLLDVLGPEDPAQARAQDQFLWRADYSSDQLHSGIYGQSVAFAHAPYWATFQALPDNIDQSVTEWLRLALEQVDAVSTAVELCKRGCLCVGGSRALGPQCSLPNHLPAAAHQCTGPSPHPPGPA